MLIIDNLSVGYRKGINVLNGLSLKLKSNKIHGLVGLNGAGKTTLLNTIFGILKQTTGTIIFNDEKLTKKQICYLENENFFYSNITGAEYLSLFVNKDFDLNAWNTIFELPLNSLIENYSTGMKKKLALLGLLKIEKPLIILDEPFNGLDIEACKVLQLIILRLREKNKLIIVTSHILESLTTICDEIHYLENGVIKFSKSFENFHHLETEIFHDFNKTELINKLL